MKFYLLLCISLTLAAEGMNFKNARNVTNSTMMTNLGSTSNLNEHTPTTYGTESNCPEGMETIPWRRVGIILNCYCKYPYLPYPVNGTCYELFKKGPCAPGNFLVQPLYNKQQLPLPRCVVNPCVEDGLVPYSGRCHNITAQPLCNKGPIYFKESTSEVRCRSLTTRQSAITFPERRKCQIGYRKDRNGECRRKI